MGLCAVLVVRGPGPRASPRPGALRRGGRLWAGDVIVMDSADNNNWCFSFTFSILILPLPKIIIIIIKENDS